MTYGISLRRAPGTSVSSCPWQALRAYSPRGAYVNFLTDDEGQERVRESYQGNYDRLVQIKRQYDPTNLFRLNQNIKP
jgi:hypothetical protein